MTIQWQNNPDEAMAQAKSSGKLVMLDFSAGPQ